ncbi:MAG: T9SS type A sorting domain-containing protein [Bacteroidales bacterium]|nr:T9SS type A sorting domain-containing protein [Bacteroidales bacterium]
MKKIVFLLLLGMVFRVSAQTPKYIRIDTVYKPYFQFDYRQWLDTDNTHPLGSMDFEFQVPFIGVHDDDTTIYYSTCYYGDALQYNYFEEPTDVYGLAMYNSDLHAHDHFNCSRRDPYRQEYLYLYEAVTDTFQLMAQVPWTYTAPVTELDTFPNWVNVYGHICGQEVYHGNDWPFCRRDFYFDKPIRVQDSFYVGFSNNWGKRNPDDPDSADWFRTYYGVLSTSLTSDQNHRANCYMSPDSACWIKNKMKLFWKPHYTDTLGPGLVEHYFYNLRPHEWVYKIVPEFFLVLPIIQEYDTVWAVDTPACTPVWTFDVMSTYGNTVRLRWTHDGTHDEWQVSYGPHGTLPDDGTKVNCHTNTWSYRDTVGELMVAYVRTVCRELDTLRYSEWSEGVEWQVNVGIETQGGGLAEVRLRPNPASEWVEVVSAVEVQGIEVYDAGGVKWREMPRSTAGFTVRDWAKGTYMVVIHTTAGSVTKRLVVE